MAVIKSPYVSYYREWFLFCQTFCLTFLKINALIRADQKNTTTFTYRGIKKMISQIFYNAEHEGVGFEYAHYHGDLVEHGVYS